MSWLVLLGSDRPIRADDLAFTLGMIPGIEASASGPEVVIAKDARSEVRCTISGAPWVIEESRELAAMHATDGEAIARCARRIEIDWSDRVAAEVTNLLASIEPAIAAAHGPIWVFDSASGSFV